mmetsp:Transcript_44900/g.66037  ORF Transcript_44900/g.66037 Transcript_44900/m.66037 type:complete len:100 (-) Transcript_44900:66-365(-)
MPTSLGSLVGMSISSTSVVELLEGGTPLSAMVEEDIKLRVKAHCVLLALKEGVNADDKEAFTSAKAVEKNDTRMIGRKAQLVDVVKTKGRSRFLLCMSR